MQEYEIRIRTEGRGDTVFEVMQLNDNAAVRAARKFAGPKTFEVWRGLDCIWTARPALNLVHPDSKRL